MAEKYAKDIIRMYEDDHAPEEISKVLNLWPPLVKGVIEGYEKETRRIITNIIRRGAGVEEIMDLTGAAKELIKEIKNEIKK